MCTVPTGGEKTLCVQSPPEGEKTLCVQSQDISKQVQLQKVYIQENLRDLSVGGRLRHFLPEWEKIRVPTVDSTDHKGRIQVALQTLSQAVQGPLHNQRLRRLRQTKCLVDLYSRPVAERSNEVVHTPDSLGFYSGLFLVPKLGNRWRPVIDLSSLNKFLAIPKFKTETPESHGCLPSCACLHPV